MRVHTSTSIGQDSAGTQMSPATGMIVLSQTPNSPWHDWSLFVIMERWATSLQTTSSMQTVSCAQASILDYEVVVAAIRALLDPDSSDRDNNEALMAPKSVCSEALRYARGSNNTVPRQD